MKDFCIIDIGSNSVRFMECTMENGILVCGRKQLYTSRLAQGLLASGRLDAERMRDSVSALRLFCDTAGDRPVYAYATSAVRDAVNREDFISLARLYCPHLDLRVLSGEEEGRFAFEAASHGNGSMLDIGGGSAQLVYSGFCKSWPTGCVRAKDRLPLVQSLQQGIDVIFPWVDAQVGELEPAISPLCGVGGTITTLGALMGGQSCYNPRALGRVSISSHKLRPLISELIDMGEQRREHPLLIKRHDVIIQGALVLLYWLERLNLPIAPNDVDGMDGYAAQILASVNGAMR